MSDLLPDDVMSLADVSPDERAVLGVSCLAEAVEDLGRYDGSDHECLKDAITSLAAAVSVLLARVDAIEGIDSEALFEDYRKKFVEAQG